MGADVILLVLSWGGSDAANGDMKVVDGNCDNNDDDDDDKI